MDEIHAYSTHPVHVFNVLHNLNPTAFIPFCAFDGDMAALGEERENFSLPLCSVFQPRVLAGQMCYFVDLSNVSRAKGVRQGPAHGLTLFIDYNDERMVDIDKEVEEQAEAFGNIHEQQENKEVKIHIDTLEPFIGHGGGNYEMSSIKVMATTDDFLALSEDVRGCQIRYDTLACHLEKYQEQAEYCACHPITLCGMLYNSTVSKQFNI